MQEIEEYFGDFAVGERLCIRDNFADTGEVFGLMSARVVFPDLVVEAIVVVLEECLVDADPFVKLLEVQSG